MKYLICLAGLLLAAPVLAQSPIDESRPLAADGRVTIENMKGRVTVRTWDQPRVRITGSLGEGVEKLDIDGGNQALSIHVRYPETGGWFSRDRSGPTMLEVTLPARASVSVEGVSADIDVAGTGGRRLQLESVSGDVLVRAARADEVRLESVSGDVDAEVESRDIGVESVSGDAKLDTGLAAGGSIDAESVSGDLTLTLPADSSARRRVESFSGSIRSPVGRVETEEYGPGSHLDARLGAGNGEIRIETFSGDATVLTR